MNKQRAEIYAFRNDVLHTEHPLELAKEIIESLCSQMCHTFFQSRSIEGGWDVHGYQEWLTTNFPVALDPHALEDEYSNGEEVEAATISRVLNAFIRKLLIKCTPCKPL